MNPPKTYEQLVAENDLLRIQLEEAMETILAIRTGQIDALVVEGSQGHELYTLKTADQTYRVFIETMHEGAVTLDRQGLILYSNSTFAAMVGQPLSSVIGIPFINCIAPDYLSMYNDFFEQSWQNSTKQEMSLKQGDSDSELICFVSATPLVLDEGPCLSLILTDLTLQKQMQAQLKISNQQLVNLNATLVLANQSLNRLNLNLKQFTYIASHDLQEPLRKVQQFGDLLKEHYSSQLGDGVNYLDRMQLAASRMSTLIKDLLSYSRISTKPEALQPVSLNEVVNLALTDLELRIQETNARIEVGSLPMVVGDASQLGQLFMNLLSNALKFRQPDDAAVPPLIRLEASRIATTDLPASITPTGVAQAYYRIDVLDNGIGFDEKYLDRIFQVFQRLHGRNEFSGTGIGLAICEKVVTNHGGAITASSQVGQGSVFSVYLPA
ncbi:sensor histidine kinase [Spirosoma aerolatum]|uniref:sensor histidine kinase n=1 Tax=Spirosoma aerolatum TaxID=1211326 RepID=UPI0009AD13DB|nr:ATP-binding protein [Spirosoma aerolatum]